VGQGLATFVKESGRMRDDEPRQGVYSQSRQLAVVDERAVPIPPFLSPGYFRFLKELFADPGSNPSFVREWRRSLRRVGLTNGRLPFLAVILSVLAGIVAIGLLFFLQGMTTPLDWRIPILLGFYLPSVLASVVFFFAVYGVSRDLSDRETLQQLYLTPMHPQEIVFGTIWGSALPTSLVVACLIPAAAIIGVDLYLRNQVAGVADLAVPMGLPLMLWPHALASMVSSGAIAGSMSFGLDRSRSPLVRSLVVWLGFELFLFLPFAAYSALAWPLTFLVGGSAAVILRLVIAGGFLHHLAIRVAQQAIDEA
jgi:hypothetical protein